MLFKDRPGVSASATEREKASVWEFYRGIRQRQRNTSAQAVDHVTRERLLTTLAGNDDCLIWLGHASFFLRIKQQTIVFDPWLTPRCSPVSWAGPKRFFAAPITAKELPPIDWVLISHNHYDHCDKPTLHQLPKHDQTRLVIPQGLRSLVQPCGFSMIHELGWENSISDHEVTIHFLPAYHFSRRGFFDKNRSLWGGYAVNINGLRFYFSGDTGYGSEFTTLGQIYGPFDYGLIGIGAYEPRGLMKAVHVNPEEALQIALDMRVKQLVPMHYGTVIVTSEPIDEPLSRIKKAVTTADISLLPLKIAEIHRL